MIEMPVRPTLSVIPSGVTLERGNEMNVRAP